MHATFAFLQWFKISPRLLDLGTNTFAVVISRTFCPLCSPENTPVTVSCLVGYPPTNTVSHPVFCKSHGCTSHAWATPSHAAALIQCYSCTWSSSLSYLLPGLCVTCIWDKCLFVLFSHSWSLPFCHPALFSMQPIWIFLLDCGS